MWEYVSDTENLWENYEELGGALTDADFERLDFFLSRVKDAAITDLDALDGFVASLICAHVLEFTTSLLSPLVQGESEEDSVPFDELEILELSDLMTRYMKDTYDSLTDENKPYSPRIRDCQQPGGRWMKGFAAGLGICSELWEDILQTEKCLPLLFCLGGLDIYDIFNLTPRYYESEYSKMSRKELLKNLAVEVKQMFDYFAAEMQKFTSEDEESALLAINAFLTHLEEVDTKTPSNRKKKLRRRRRAW